MRAKVRLVAILATSIVVLTASSAPAQPEPIQAPRDWGILSEVLDRTRSEVLDRTRLVARNVQPSEGQDAPPSFLRDVASDFVRFFTARESVVILGLGVAGSLSVLPLDDDIQQNRLEARSPGQQDDTLTNVFKAGSHLGSTLVQAGGSFATYTIGRLAGKPGVADFGRDLIRVQLLTGGVTQLLKHTVRRERPGGSGSSRTSFPSGHTSSTFASATVLSRRFGWKVGVPMFGLASYVAASRVVDNSHFLSDVVFGAAIGMTAGRAVTFERGTTTVQVSPMAVPRGIGVLVSLN
jgi:hypothetical protein